MVASKHVKITFYGGIGRQRGRGFGALEHVFSRTVIPFLRQYNIPATKRLSAELLDFAVPETEEVASGRENVKTAAKSVGRHILKKQLGSGRWTRTASRVNPAKSAKKPVSRGETFPKKLLINLDEQFLVPNFCGGLWKSWRESPSSSRCLVVPRT